MHNDVVPRSALIAGGVIIVLSIAFAAMGRLTGMADSRPTAQPVVTRELLFQDKANGGVAVYDAHLPSLPIEMISPETNGFLRASVRGLAQQRLRQDANPSVPFRLTAWADGRLTLEDSTTGRRIDMEAFGPTNEAVFAHLLTAKAGS